MTNMMEVCSEIIHQYLVVLVKTCTRQKPPLVLVYNITIYTIQVFFKTTK